MSSLPRASRWAFLSNIRIGVRLALGFTVLLAMIIGMGIEAAREVTSTARATRQLYDHPFTVTQNTAAARFAAVQLFELAHDVGLGAARKVDKAQENTYRQTLSQTLESAAAAYLGPKADLQAVRDAIASFLATIDQVAALAEQGKQAEAHALVGTLEARFSGVIQTTTAMLNAAGTRGRQFVATSQETAERVVQMIWIVTGLAVAAGLLVTFLTSRGITGPLTRLRRDMHRLAEGERAFEIQETGRRDEIGDMARTVLVLQENLQAADAAAAGQAEERARNEKEKTAALVKMAETIETETIAALQQVNDRADEMTSTARGLSTRAETTNRSAAGAAEAASEALATVQTVSSAAEQLAASIREISGQMNHSTILVGQAVTAGGEARGTIEALNETVMRIGVVADMIGEIAGKTNLLALNATIEAARAGDAGKGFAVVASEVKQLAAQTARSTEEIAQHINEVRTATSASVAAVTRIEDTIGQINAVAGSIAAAVEEQGAATADIARSVAQTAEAANLVTARIGEVSTEADGTGRDAERVHDTASGLAQSVSDLRRALVRVVRTSSSDVDRRTATRYQTDMTCHLVLGADLRVGRLVDISTGGAGIRDAGALAVGTTGRLRLGGVGFELPFTVRDGDGEQIHVAFNLDPAMAEKFASIPERLGHRQAA